MFASLTGNERAKDTLRRMLAGRRVPGALLFAGAEGVGKKLFALETAKALNCPGARAGELAEACDCCPACVRLSRFAQAFTHSAEGNGIIWSDHPDVGLVRPGGRFIVIGQAREVEREANFRPYEGAARVFIIDEADRLNEPAANSLLKTLEEAPPTTHLLLITARPASILPTIRSRCQMVRFAPLTTAEIAAHLSAHGGGKKLSAADAQLAAQLARGSLGRALALDPQSYRAQRETMLAVLEALTVRPDKARLLRAAEDLSDAKRKDEYEPRLEALETLIHDVWRLALAGDAAEIVNEDARATLARITTRVPSRRAARWLQRIEDLRGQLAVNINRRVATDALLLAMAQD